MEDVVGSEGFPSSDSDWYHLVYADDLDEPLPYFDCLGKNMFRRAHDPAELFVLIEPYWGGLKKLT